MNKRHMILPLALILCFVVGCRDKEEMAELEAIKSQAEVEEQNKEIDEELRKKAIEIHFEAIVIDAHAHPMTSYAITPDATPDNLDLGKKTEYSSVDFITMKEGGLDAVFFSLPLLNDINAGNPKKKIFEDWLV